jgi:ABC-type phosphate/phosphonate transport system substrate-binding protein
MVPRLPIGTAKQRCQAWLLVHRQHWDSISRTLKRRIDRRWVLVWLVSFSVLGAYGARGQTTEAMVEPFRIGFSISLFTDVNINDAKAVVRVLGGLIAKEEHLAVDPDPIIYKNINSLQKSLQDNQVDAVGMTTIEYARLRRQVDFDPIFITDHARRHTVQYLLLVNRHGRVHTLADLRGKRLRYEKSPQACLAPLWLDELLARHGYADATHFLGKPPRVEKLSKTVLSVFFGQTDACVVAKSGFNTMVELNPQLAKKLVILAQSPEVVPVVFAIRAAYHPIDRDKLIAGLEDLDKTPDGQQVLTIFVSDGLEILPKSELEPTLKLIESHQRFDQEVQRS